jgi:hypothetical protein
MGEFLLLSLNIGVAAAVWFNIPSRNRRKIKSNFGDTAENLTSLTCIVTTSVVKAADPKNISIEDVEDLEERLEDMSEVRKDIELSQIKVLNPALYALYKKMVEEEQKAAQSGN